MWSLNTFPLTYLKHPECVPQEFMLPYIQCSLYLTYISHSSCTLHGCGCMWHGWRVEGVCHVPQNPYIIMRYSCLFCRALKFDCDSAFVSSWTRFIPHQKSKHALTRENHKSCRLFCRWSELIDIRHTRDEVFAFGWIEPLQWFRCELELMDWWIYEITNQHYQVYNRIHKNL